MSTTIFNVTLKSSLKPAAAAATDYRSTIIADNPVAYYRLGEASGATATDEMGSSNGAYGNDTTYGVTGALNGDSNTSVSFAGSSTTNDAIQVSSLTSADFSSGITIELWLNWDSSTGTGMPVEVREGNDGQDRIFFDARSSGTPHWDFNIAGTWYSATGAGVQDGWNLYAFTHDGSNAKTYRNGVLQNTTSASATTFDPDSMGIGQDGNGSNVIVGGVDEVAVYNSALSATELLAHYTAGTTGGGGDDNPGTSNLVAWLGMEEGSGNSVADSTSNNNDFTKTNGSWVTGKVGSYAVRLDGNDDYIESDANFAVGANVCTVSFWMYWTDAGSDEKFIYELGNRWWQRNGSIAFSWVQNESVFKVSMHDGSGNLEVKISRAVLWSMGVCNSCTQWTGWKQ